jgi:hypothetical protein
LAAAWQAFSGELAAQRQGQVQWQEGLARVGDLTGNLLKFCREML